MQHITRVWLDNSTDLSTPHDDLGEAVAARAERQEDADPAARGASGRLPFVSVVVVTRASLPRLVRCLEALARQTYPVERMEVVVVDRLCGNGTAGAVATLARQRPGLRLCHTLCAPGASLALARNAGWRRARGEVVGFTGDAAVPSNEWVMAAASLFDPAIDVVSGTVVVPLPARPASAVREATQRVQAPWSAANVFYRRALLVQLQGFDERFVSDAHGSVDLALAALGAQAGFAVAERAVVIHDLPAREWLAGLREQRAHAEEALLAKKHRTLYWRHVRQWPPLGHYVAAGALLTASAGLLLNRRALSWRALTLWGALTLFRFARAMRGTSDDPRDLADLLLSTAIMPPAAAGFRLAGALRHRVWFV